MCYAGSDKEDQVPQGRFNSFNAGATTPTTAQPVAPGFLDASQEEGELPLPYASTCCCITGF